MTNKSAGVKIEGNMCVFFNINEGMTKQNAASVKLRSDEYTHLAEDRP